jgi:hypothetical protein
MLNQLYAVSDPDMVKALVDHLIAAYNQFVDAREVTEPGIGFMAAHNFHCVIVFDMERQGGLSGPDAEFLRRAAVTTFRERLEREKLPGGIYHG